MVDFNLTFDLCLVCLILISANSANNRHSTHSSVSSELYQLNISIVFHTLNFLDIHWKMNVQSNPTNGVSTSMNGSPVSSYELQFGVVNYSEISLQPVFGQY